MIQDTLSKVVYTADGEQREWDVPFQFYDSKDLHIYLTDDGVRVEEVFQNFEIVENGEKKEVDNPDVDFNKEGNYVIYPTPESGLAPLEAGKQILILRETPNTQEEDSSEIYFKSKDIERGLDKLTMQVQELARDSYRAVKVSHFDTTSPEDFTEMLFEVGAKAEEAAGRAAASESNAASSASSAQSASATATAAAQLAESLKSDTEEFAKRAENAASDASASASQASDLLQEISNSTYNKEQIDEKVSKLENAQASAIAGKQDKLVAGANITIKGNVISATGGGGEGGGGGSVPENVYTKENLLGGKDIEIVPEPVDGGVDEYTTGVWHFDSSMFDEINNKGFSYDRVGTYIDGKFGKGVYSVYGGRTDSEILCETQSIVKDFTIDCVVLPKDTSSSGTVLYLYAGDQSGDYYGLSVTYSMIGGSVSLGHRSAVLTSKTLTPLTAADKPHLALQRRGVLVEVFIEGKKEIEYDISSIVGELTGKGFGVNSANWVGIDELRISNIARYTGDFTPPTQPYHKAEPTGNYVINYVKPVGEVEALKTDFSNYSGFPHTIDPQKTDGVLYLQTNKIYRIALEGHTVLSLPTMPDETTSSNQILVKAYVNSGASLDWGTYNFYNKSVPTLEEETYYDLVFDYDQLQLAWVAAAIPSGRTDI